MTATGERRRWSYALIRRCTTPPPKYGSLEWASLPENDPRRIAAVVVAAEAWARAGDDLEDTLRTELELAQRATKALEDADYVERARAHREQWKGRLTLIKGAYADTEKFRSGGESA